MTNQRDHYLSMANRIKYPANPVPVEFNFPRFTKMSSAMFLIMIVAAIFGTYIGYQINHNFIVSLVFGGLFGRIGMWAGMIGCGLIAGIEDFLSDIF
jgi:hypothetical protein